MKNLARLGVIAFASLYPSLMAQFEAPLLSRIQPNLVNPGGKSIAMGGAFVSIADDATAALANPAGLWQLTRYEVALSGKYFNFSPTFASQEWEGNRSTGKYSLSQSSIEYKPESNVTDLEFVSVVIPVSRRISVAAYYGANLRYKIDATKTFSEDFRYFSITEDASNVLSIDESGSFDLRNQLFGLSAGARYRMFSIGAGVTFNQLKYKLSGPGSSGQHLFFVNQDNLDASGDQLPGQDLAYKTEVTAGVESGTKIGFVLGARVLLYEPNSLALGISFRKSARYNVKYSVRALLPNQTSPFVEFGCGKATGDAVMNASACGTLGVPDDLSIGISVNPVPPLTLALEGQRIWYSDLTNGYVPLFVYCQTRGVSSCPANMRAVSNATVDDGTVFRAGAEYTFVFASNSRLSIRGGYYYEPAHGMKVDLYPDANADRRADSDTPAEVSSPPFTSAYRTLFDGAKAENHVSFGFGYSPSSSWAFDLAGDYSKSSQYFVLSGVYRWGSPK